MRVVFFGTGEIARPAFKALLERPDTSVLGLVTQPDKPSGRHQNMKAPAIKEDALSAGLAVWQPEKARELVPVLAALQADVFMVMAYGQILPQALIDLPRSACWNLHASLLPRHRGASPIQAAILAGDEETGVTVMRVARALDSGDIVHAEKIAVGEEETGGALQDRLALLAPVAMNRALDDLAAGSAGSVPQNPREVTVLGKLERCDGRIDWHQPAQIIARRIRAFDPWPGSFSLLPDGKTLKLFPPVGMEGGRGEPGEVLAGPGAGLNIACGVGSLRIAVVQPEGKRRMAATDYLRGHPLAGAVLVSEPQRL